MSFTVTGISQERGPPLPKFGEWNVNDPASAEGYTVIFNKARNEKRTGGKSESPPKVDSAYKRGSTATLGKPQSATWVLSIPYAIEFRLLIWWQQ
ncbi:hypothetical protein RD792_000235 [Penstemon davidsonii]|uniref:RIN4 pathogenic type III effector avirulence factor Avr cleavage site domain-containing protein n=1 Tax=Penstemon davidsonii TaxID=160366 RepID=A0ABR0DVI5_9LAMI|nr:hypothetical protein RD792_000235 [Penstemon davidsonii]